MYVILFTYILLWQTLFVICSIYSFFFVFLALIVCSSHHQQGQ